MVLCRFRALLIDRGLLEQLFAEVDRQLDRARMMLKRGTMLNPTLVAAGNGRAWARRAAARPGRPADSPQGQAGHAVGACVEGVFRSPITLR
jgi:IS5 family transposase